MKNIFKILLSFIIVGIIASTCIMNAYAWNQPTIKVSYTEEDSEFRSVWVCTVSNMDVDKQIGTSDGAIEAWKKQYIDILNNAVMMNMNAIIFQVRPCNDAFYPSKYNPWSEYLAGFGVDPGWDPLEWMIGITHAAGLEYHAWLNPYRASNQSLLFNITQSDGASTKVYDYNQTEAANYKEQYFGDLKNICKNNDTMVDNPIFSSGEEFQHDVLYGTEGKFILNPASTNTQEHLENTIKELVDNYDLDGIHFDDYFYPATRNYMGSNADYKKVATFSCEPSVDIADYQAYINGGGVVPSDSELTPEQNKTREIYNWRRMNVNNLIESLSKIIRDSNKKKDINCAFGISPAARWAPSVEYCGIRGAVGGMGGSGDCNNYYSYSDLYADVYKWVKEEWIDYIVPQVYTFLGTSQSGIPSGSYNGLVKWWSNACKDYNVKLFIGTPAYQITNWTTSGSCTSLELFWQIKWNQAQNYHVDGYVMFRYDSLILKDEMTSCIKTVVSALWKNPALSPVYDYYDYPTLDKAAVINKLEKNADGSYTVNFEAVDNAKAYAVLEDGKVVSRALSAKPLIFNKTEGKTYQFVTYSKDNKIHQDKQTIDFTTAKENEQPVVSCLTKLNAEYLTSSKFTIEFSVVDPEGGSVSYNLDAVYGTSTFNLVNKGTVKDNIVSFEFTCYAVEMKGMKFILTINDGFGDVTCESATFDIVKTLTPIVDDDDDEGETDIDNPSEHPDPPVIDEGKKGCKKSSVLIINLISTISIISIILRKKK